MRAAIGFGFLGILCLATAPAGAFSMGEVGAAMGTQSALAGTGGSSAIGALSTVKRNVSGLGATPSPTAVDGLLNGGGAPATTPPHRASSGGGGSGKGWATAAGGGAGKSWASSAGGSGKGWATATGNGSGKGWMTAGSASKSSGTGKAWVQGGSGSSTTVARR